MTVELILGDCLEVLAGLPENSVDTCITDPPYELGFMGKKWDSSGIEREAEYVEIAEKRIAHYRLPILDDKWIPEVQE